MLAMVISRPNKTSRPLSQLPPLIGHPHTPSAMASGLADAEQQEMRKRIDLRRLHVRIGRQYAFVSKSTEGSRPSCQPKIVVVERVDLRGLHVGVVARYPWVSNSAFGLRPSFQPMVWKCWNGSTAGRGDVGILLQVIDIVEAVRADHLRRCESLAALRPLN